MDNCGSRCPGGRYCDCAKCNDRREFHKLLELKETVVYRHNKHQNVFDDAIEMAKPKPSYSRPFATEHTFAAKTNSADDNIAIVIQFDEHKKDPLHDLDLNKVNCPRCREILKRAKAMPATIPTVQNKETICMCELCRLNERFRGPCQHCQKSIEKFKSMKPLMARKEDHLKNQLDSLLRSKTIYVIKMEEHEKRRSYSDIDILETFRQKTRESFDQTLGRPKSGMTVYSKVQSMHDKKGTCLLQKQIEANKFITDFKTQVDLKKPVPGRVKEDYYQKDKMGRSLPLLKSDEQQEPGLMKKTPYQFGLQSETVLGIGTTGIMRRSYSDEGLITSLSCLTEEVFKNNFKYFFPGGIKKKKTVVKTSEELIGDMRDRLQVEADEKLKKKEQLMLIKLEKQREKETAIEKIKLKTERAKRQRILDIDINSGKIMQRIKREVSDMKKGDNFITKQSERRGIETKEKLDKKTDEPIEKKNMVQSVKEEERLGKHREEKEHITSVERRSMLYKEGEHKGKEKDEKKIKEAKTMKEERKIKEEIEKHDVVKEQKKEKPAKVEKVTKKSDTVKTERTPNEKVNRVDKVKEERKEKKQPVKVEVSKPPDTAKTEQKSKEKEDRKEKENLTKADKISKQPETVKIERKPKEKEESVHKEKVKRKEKEKQVNVEKITKTPDTVKTERKPKEKEERKEKEKLVNVEKVSKTPDTVKTERKPKEKEERKEKEKLDNIEKISKTPETVKTERKPKEKDKETGKVKQEQHETRKSDIISKVSKETGTVKEEEKRKERKEMKDTEKPVQKAKEINKKSQEKKDQASKEKGEKAVLFEKDAADKKTKFDKKNKKPARESAVQDKDETTGKNSIGVTYAEDKLLESMLKKEEKIKLDAIKAKQSSDAKYIKDMQKADAVLTKKSVEPKNLDVRDKPKKKEEGGGENAKYIKDMQKADAVLTKKSVEPKNLDVRDKPKNKEEGGGEKMRAEKSDKKSDGIDFKDVIYKPSEDNLILRLVRTAARPIKDIKSLPVLAPLPNSLKIIRRVRRKKSIGRSSLRSELALDAESILRKRMESKNVVEKEIIYGEKIYLEKDIPQEPERVKAAIFETAFEDKTSFEPGTGRNEIEQLLEPDKQDEKGVVRYVLSDRKFIDKGWTILPTQKVFRKLNMYKMHPAKPEFDWFERNKGKGPMAYDSGEKLAEVTDNGRGKWYYKNGKIALDYYESEDLNAQQRVVIYSSGEPDERGRSRPVTVLGMFDHLGSGVVFDHYGKIRLKYNQNEGVILDRELGPVTHWLWHSLNEPPELEQVIIDTQLPYKEPEIMKLGDLDVRKDRLVDERMVAIELDNLIKSRITKSTPKFIPHQIRMKAFKINNQFSLKILDQKTIHLSFREGLNTLKLNLGMTLDDTEILDTRTSELHDVSVDIENKPARTDSVTNLQKILSNTQRLHQVRAGQELRTRPLLPAVSAERLTAAISKPLRGSLLASTELSKHCKCRAVNVYYNNRLI